MQIFKDTQTLNSTISAWRGQGDKIAFVPTMGNLHEGHLSLVDKARAMADKVIVSIYVNPMQFGVNEDFDAYPRTLNDDQAALEPYAVEGLFLPVTSLMYPRSPETTTKVEVPYLSTILCGEFRPGHFTGVATIVCKLLNLVRPDFLILGAKDYQQVAVIRQMVKDLFMHVEIVTGATIRELDGLAKSSRNQYLSLKERQCAPILHKIMTESVAQAKNGDDLGKVESNAVQTLIKSGFNCEYYQFRHAETLEMPKPGDKSLVLLAAARLGKTRLIDNIALTLLENG